MSPKRSGGERLAHARREKGLSQAQLAREAGMTRQGLNQIERGAALPRVDTAIRIAAALDEPVESLFGTSPAAASQRLEVLWPDDHPPSPGARVDLARIGGHWVASPSDPAARLGPGLGLSDGRLVAAKEGICVETAQPLAELGENILLAGCDPALALVSEVVSKQASRGRCIWQPCGSSTALRRLAEGRVHAAGIHFGGDDESNLAEIRRWGLESRCLVVRFSRWEEGWMFRPATRFRGLEDFADPRLRLANRETGSGCRRHLDDLLAEQGLEGSAISGYGSVSFDHADCARRIVRSEADVGLGCEPMARISGLAFAPVREVAFDLAIRTDHLDRPLASALLSLLVDRRFLRRMAEIPGYSLGETGRVVSRHET